MVLRKISIILVLLLMIACAPKSQILNFPTGAVVQESQNSNDALITLALSAKAYELSDESLFLTVSDFEVRENDKWIKLNIGDVSVDLTQLRNNQTRIYLGQDKLTAGSYDKIKFNFNDLKKGSAKTYSQSNTVEFPIPLLMKAGKTAMVELNLLIDESLHKTLNDASVFAPVWQITRSEIDGLEISSDRTFTLKKERKELEQKVGMDLDGKTRLNSGIPATANLRVDDGVITEVELEKKTAPEPYTPKKDDVKISLTNNVANPFTTEVKAGTKARLVFQGYNEDYGIQLEGYNKKLQILAEEPTVLEVTVLAGKQAIKCSEPCRGKEGRLMGWINGIAR